MCNGKLLDVLAATANFSIFYGVCRGPECSGYVGPRGGSLLTVLPSYLPRCCWTMLTPHLEVLSSCTS